MCLFGWKLLTDPRHDYEVQRAIDKNAIVIMKKCGIPPLMHAAYNYIRIHGNLHQNIFRHPETTQEKIVWPRLAKEMIKNFQSDFSSTSLDCYLSLQPILHLRIDERLHVMCEMFKQMLEARITPWKDAQTHQLLTRAVEKCLADNSSGMANIDFQINSTEVTSQEHLLHLLMDKSRDDDMCILSHLVDLINRLGEKLEVGILGCCLFGWRLVKLNFADTLLKLVSGCKSNLFNLQPEDAECQRLKYKIIGLPLSTVTDKYDNLPEFYHTCIRSICSAYNINKFKDRLCMSQFEDVTEDLKLSLIVNSREGLRHSLEPAKALQCILLFFNQMPIPLIPSSVVIESEICATKRLYMLSHATARILAHLAVALALPSARIDDSEMTAEKFGLRIAPSIVSDKCDVTKAANFLTQLICKATNIDLSFTYCYNKSDCYTIGKDVS